MPPTSSQIKADEHHRYVTYHTGRSAEHDKLGQAEAAAKHRVAAMAHEAAMLSPLDKLLSGAAMRASAMADEVSQRAGRG